MASGKINPENYDSLKLCWSREHVTEVASKGGKLEYTVDELMRSPWIEFEDVMIAVCNTEVIDEEVLYTYAGIAARNQLSIIERAFPGETVFAEAVAAALDGDATEKAEASTKVDRAMRRLSKEVLDDIVTYACKSVRACVHINAASAALGAGINAAATHENAKTGKTKQRELMRTVFRDSEVMRCQNS